MHGQAGGLLGGAGTRPPGVPAEAHGSGGAGVEAGGQRVGGADEGRRLLQGGAGLQEACLLLEGRRLAVQGGRGRERGPQQRRGLVEGGGGGGGGAAGRHRNLSRRGGGGSRRRT